MLFPGLPARITACFGASFALRMSMTCHVQVLVASMIKSIFFHGRPYCSWNLPWGTAMWTAFSGCTVPSNFGYTMILLFHNSRLAVLPFCMICTGFTFRLVFVFVSVCLFACLSCFVWFPCCVLIEPGHFLRLSSFSHRVA